MSSYEKVIKLACKPKAAPPKAKYIDTIIAATYSEDGAVHDVCKALTPKFKEPNAIVVFKALIVLHTMMRNGSTDNVLSYLSQSDVLRLRNVTNGQWEGYTPPQNLSHYALYLDCRIRSYRELKHDAIRVQSESNRDLRVGSMEGDAVVASLVGASSSNKPVQRSKTIMGRKLRVMTVEKGLLRETKIVQKLVDTLLDCQFYLDDLEDELTITALRMLVKDLLVLFQAVNEGVINVLEHYFEMTHVDAKAALALYRLFCRQTERVVEYLTVARKLQNLLNVPIPNLKHAPVSLAGALEEYLQDPNFEQNRIEYKVTKEQAAANKKNPKPIIKKTETKPAAAAASASSAPTTASSSGVTTAAKKPDANKDLVDFFTSIETEQSNLFGSNSPTTANQVPAFNPFMQNQNMIATGAGPSPFGISPSPFINVQPTGMVVPQTMAFPGLQQTNPFGSLQQPQATGFPGIQAQMTGFPASQSQPNGLLSPSGSTAPFLRPQSAAANFLQPQATGSNPFRLSMMNPQMTGMPGAGGPAGTMSPFGAFGNAPSNSNPFGVSSQPAQLTNPQSVSTMASPFASTLGGGASKSPFPFVVPDISTNPPTSAPATNTTSPFIARPASTPITSNGPTASPLVSQQTGSRNPFGRPKSPPPPAVPPLPTMGQLATGKFGSLNGATPTGGQTNGFGSAFANWDGGSGQTTTNSTSPFGAPAAKATNQNGLANLHSGAAASGTMSNIASMFTFDSANKPSSPPPSNTSATGASLFGSPPFNQLSAQTTSTSTAPSTGGFSAFSSTPTGTSITSTAPSFAPLQPQPTGYGGSAIKPFKPSSSFGAALLESLPTIPQGAPAPPVPTSTPSTTAPNGISNNPSLTGSLNAQPTGMPWSSSFGGGLGGGSGGGLQPQMTGANPFRASMFGESTANTTPSLSFGGMTNGNNLTPFGSTNNTAPSTNPSNGFLGSNPTGQMSPLTATPTGMKAPFKPSSSFGASLFAGMGGSGTLGGNMPGAFPTGQPQQQQNQNSVSLI